MTGKRNGVIYNRLSLFGCSGMGVVRHFFVHTDTLINPASILFLWGHIKILVYVTLVDSDHDLIVRTSVDAKYLVHLKVYSNRSNDTVKHVSLLVDIVLNSYCKHCTREGGCL